MKRKGYETERFSSHRSIEPIPLDLKKMTRLQVKPHQKKLLRKVESRVCLKRKERDGNEDDESDKRPSKLLHSIPLDLEVEIMTRLPVKSLMRSRCVSKTWSSIILSQGFVHAYYAMSSSATRSRFTVAFSNSVFVKGDAQRLFIFSSSSLAANLHMTIPSLSLSHVSDCPSVHGFVGCCYGFQFTICNPSTGQVVSLPCKGNRTSLGYDPVDGQFKALSLVPTPVRGYHICVVHEVIKLGGGGGGESRNMVTSPPYSPLTNRLCINGFIYFGAWAPRPRMNPVIVCFDVRHEKISFIKMPKDVLSYSVLIEYKGKLASVVRHQPLSFRSFDLWILEDVKKGVWSKQTFDLPCDLVNMTSPGTNKAGEIIFAPTKLSHGAQPFYIFYYNTQIKDLRRVRIHGIADDEGFRRRYGLVSDLNSTGFSAHLETESTKELDTGVRNKRKKKKMSSSSMALRDMQRDLEAKANDLAKIQKEIAKNHQLRKKYTIQLGENELVLKELDLLEDDANVYKLIGPVLVKQDLAEANANVRKRMEYISAELKRIDATLQDNEGQQNSKREAVSHPSHRLYADLNAFQHGY
ncbi:hypothetical protein HID58_025540 [Brassica napus]|uniref:F-box domain-containing protein n=1 Tax=Brassica napus TaxID=3708 RepID=A0ABQ8CLD6_BRANA|nr:hypothetical protein HID58_025540 [Brassica napus]